MRPNQVEKWLGAPRFQRFLDARGGDHARAVDLYNWNVAVSAGFIEVLHHVEVLLRNATDRQFPTTAPNHAVPCVPHSDIWLTDASVMSSKGLDKVREAARTLERRGLPLTRGRLIALQSFGFWREMYGPHYNLLWASTLKHAFPNGSGKRKQVAGMLEKIRQFRNRVAHHEAIFDGGLVGEHDRLLHLARLIDFEAETYISQQSRVPSLLAAEPR